MFLLSESGVKSHLCWLLLFKCLLIYPLPMPFCWKKGTGDTSSSFLLIKTQQPFLKSSFTANSNIHSTISTSTTHATAILSMLPKGSNLSPFYSPAGEGFAMGECHGGKTDSCYNPFPPPLLLVEDSFFRQRALQFTKLHHHYHWNDQKDFALVSLQLFSGKLETKTKGDESFWESIFEKHLT